MPNKNIVVSLIIILVIVGAWGLYKINTKSEEPTQVADNTNTEKTVPEEQNKLGCTRTFDQSILDTAKVDIKNKFVTMNVKGFGEIKVQLYDQDAPKTVENFLRLTNAKFYDCMTFHRVAKNFVIQGGDPTGTGSGGLSAFGGEFADELNASTASYKAGYAKGVLAMANRGPNTNTSQFFIMLDDVELPKNYTIFGKVVAGLDVVDKIGAVQIVPQLGATDGSPVEPIVIESAVISDK